VNAQETLGLAWVVGVVLEFIVLLFWGSDAPRAKR